MFLVAGNLTVDYVNGVRRPGGFAYYASIALRLLREEVGVASCIGEDYPVDYLEFLKRMGIKLFLSMNNSSTIFRLEYYNDTRILRLESQGGQIELASILSSILRSNSINDLVLLLGPVAGELGVEDIVYAKKYSNRIVVEVQGFIRRFTRTGEILYEWTSDFIEALRNVMLVHVSEDEARILGEVEETVLFLSKYARIVALTMSSKGSLVGYNGSLYHIGVPRIYEGDPTGAGDTYTAVFASYLSRGYEPVEAARHATIAAGLKIYRSNVTSKWFNRLELEELAKSVEVERIY